MVLYLAKFMTLSSIVVQRESVGCLAELAQVRIIPFGPIRTISFCPIKKINFVFRIRKINDFWLKIKSVDIQLSNGWETCFIPQQNKSPLTPLLPSTLSTIRPRYEPKMSSTTRVFARFFSTNAPQSWILSPAI